MKALMPILLLISLVFNAAFLVGYVAYRTNGQPPAITEEMTETVADELGLDKAQRETFESLLKQNAEEGAQLREAIRATREALLDEIGSPDSDPERVATLQGELAEFHQTYRDTLLHRYSKFMDVLKPEQRRAVTEKMHRHHGRHGRGDHGPPWMRGKSMERFDADGDGQLDEEEREKAREALLKEFGSGRGGGMMKGFGPPSPMPETLPLFRATRAVRKVMGGLNDERKVKVQEALKKMAESVEQLETDLAGILTEEEMRKYREAKESGFGWGPGPRRGRRSMGGHGGGRGRPPRQPK